MLENFTSSDGKACQTEVKNVDGTERLQYCL